MATTSTTTATFTFAPLPALTAHEKDARVWAWICAQSATRALHSATDALHSAAADDDDAFGFGPLDVEDEGARIRSSFEFSDASETESESEVLFVDPDYAHDQLVDETLPEPFDSGVVNVQLGGMMTLDDLVLEIDAWLAARRMGVDLDIPRYGQDRASDSDPDKAYQYLDHDHDDAGWMRRNHGADAPAIMATPHSLTRWTPIAAPSPASLSSPTTLPVPPAAPRMRTISLRQVTSDLSLRDSFRPSLRRKESASSISLYANATMDSIASILRPKPARRPSVATTFNISAPLTAPVSEHGQGHSPSGSTSSDGGHSNSSSDADSACVLTPSTSLTHIVPSPRVATASPSLAVDRALPTLRPATVTMAASGTGKPPVPSAPKPHVYLQRASSQSQSQSQSQANYARAMSPSPSPLPPAAPVTVTPPTLRERAPQRRVVSKREISAPQPAPSPSKPKDDDAVSLYAPRPARSPLNARAPSPPPLPTPPLPRENPYALYQTSDLKRGRRLSDIVPAGLRSPSRSGSRTSSPTRPSPRRERGAAPPSAFNPLGSLAAAGASTSSLLKRKLSQSFSRSPSSSHHDQRDDEASDSDEEFELVHAPHDAAYKGALAFGASYVSDPQSSSSPASRPGSRLSLALPNPLHRALPKPLALPPHRPAASNSPIPVPTPGPRTIPTPGPRTALLVKAPPHAFEAVRRWASEQGALGRMDACGKKGIRVVWRDPAAVARVSPGTGSGKGGGSRVVLEGVGLVALEVVKVKA